MSVPVAAAAHAAATGLAVEVSGPRAVLTLCSGPADGRAAHGAGAGPGPPDLAAALEDVLRGLRGNIRVVVLRELHHLNDQHPHDHHAHPHDEHPGDEHPGDEHRARPPVERWARVARRLAERADLLSVALLTERTSGLGLALALACDLRVMADDASLCLTDTVRGRVPALGAARALVDTVGYADALWLCLTGEPVAAAEAVRRGLAVRVVPAADLAAEVDRLTARLLAAPRDAVTETKALLAGADRGRSTAARQREAETEAEAERDALLRLLGTSAWNAG